MAGMLMPWGAKYLPMTIYKTKWVIYIKSDLYPKGEFVPELEARLTVFDRGFTIGDSAYEYARTYNHKPFQVSKHMERMFSSLKVMITIDNLIGFTMDSIPDLWTT